ncbi:MAG TPA: hypothetical protein VKU85_02735, partial [bacterium]|nr:hypothetical protein [bacterium]
MNVPAVLLLIAAPGLGAPLPPGGPVVSPPFTLHPEPPGVGDTLLCVIESPLQVWPARESGLR